MPLRILVTDDSAFMRTMLKNFLSKEGVEVVGEAVDGADSVQKVGQLNPDIVFMDVMMPNMTGIEALKIIKAQHPNVKVFMCTSVGQEIVVNEAVEAGASEFIVKPFKPEDIHEVISKYTTPAA